MTVDSIKVLVVEDDVDYAALVQHWLSVPSEGLGFEVAWTDSLEAAKSRLARGGIDLVLLDLSLPDSDGLDTFTELHGIEPAPPIIVLSAADSEAVALLAIQRGAQDYLVKSVCTTEMLVRAIRYAHLRHLSRTVAPTEGPRVIGLLGAKGGVGVTTAACILAEELSVQTKGRVLLADLDVHSGSTAFLLGLDPKYSFADLAAKMDRLDLELWRAVVIGDGTSLDVLCSPAQLGAGELTAKPVQRVLSFVQPLYDWVVLDLGRFQPLSAAILPLVTDILLVTNPSIPALYEAKRIVGHLAAQDREGERLRLVINQTERTDSLQNSELNKVFGAPVFAQIPNDGDALRAAILDKHLPGQGSNLRMHIRRMARNLAHLEVAKPKPRRSVPQMFSFLSRPKKAEPHEVMAER